jgi:general secretion pathway protein L
MSTLVVSLPPGAPTTATEWAYAFSGDGHALSDHGRAPAALLPTPRGAGAETVALVPIQALAWQQVELPKGVAAGTPRLRAALEGVLEERLLDDPESLHLALQPGARGGETAWVAVCDRGWLRDALQVLESAGRPVSRIVPEFAPDAPASLVALGTADDPWMVATSSDGLLALPLTPAAVSLLPALPEGAPRLAEPAVAALAEQWLGQPWTLQQPAQRWLQAARTPWDLAQFDFARSSRDRALKKIATGWSEILRSPAWRPARWGAVALVAIQLVGLNAWAWKERATLDDKREAIRRVLRDTFPQVRVVVDAPVQMEREVATLRQQTGTASARDLDAMLAALAAALPAGRTPGALEYTNGQLRVQGLTLSTEEVRRVSTQLRGLGYSATAEGQSLLVAAEDVR